MADDAMKTAREVEVEGRLSRLEAKQGMHNDRDLLMEARITKIETTAETLLRTNEHEFAWKMATVGALIAAVVGMAFSFLPRGGA